MFRENLQYSEHLVTLLVTLDGCSQSQCYYMPRTATPLTNTQINNAKSKDREYNLSDGEGLMLRVKPNGSKLWIFNYYHPTSSKRKVVSLGGYPDISLANARKLRAHNRALVANGIDPQENREEERRKNVAAYQSTFENLAAEWLESKAFEVTAW